MKPDDILNRGTDISSHYLQDNNHYKIVRYNNNVYAVSFDEKNNPRDFVHLWKSNNKNNQIVERRLGHGVRGIVYQKTEDKVKKTPVGQMGRVVRQTQDKGEGTARRPPPRRRRAQSTPEQVKEKMSASNTKILNQRFALKENGLDSIFTFGLHSIKNLPDENVFFMPKISTHKVRSKEEKKMYTDFFLKLKQVNEMGFAHDDYCGTVNCKHTNFANAMLTKDGVRMIDMDNGLYEIGSHDDELMLGYNARMRDQWFLAYLNTNYPDQVLKMEDWYQDNGYRPISESPEAIREFVANNNIDLPKEIMDNLEPGNVQSLGAASSSAPSSSNIVASVRLDPTEKLMTVHNIVATKEDFRAMREKFKADSDKNKSVQSIKMPRLKISRNETNHQDEKNRPKISKQVKYSHSAVENQINRSDFDNREWERFLKLCSSFVPDTRLMQIVPLYEQLARTKKAVGFTAFENHDALQHAVAFVLKAIITPSNPTVPIAQTQATKQFIEKFNNGEINGEIKNAIYQIVGKASGELTPEHFANKHQEITAMSDAVLEHGFTQFVSKRQEKQ